MRTRAGRGYSDDVSAAELTVAPYSDRSGSAGHGAGEVAFVFAFGDGAAFVVLLLAFAEADEDLGVAVFEVDLEGDEREALLAGLAVELDDFFFVGEEEAGTLGVVFARAGGAVGLDVDAKDGERWGDGSAAGACAGVGADEAVDDGDFAVADAFDLWAAENEAALEGFEDVVVVPSLAVFDHAALVGVGFGGLFRHLG